MHTMRVESHSGRLLDDREVAAAIVAVSQYLARETLESQSDAHFDWEHSGRLVRLGIVPRRMRVTPSWANVERLRRDHGGGSGVTGL